MAGQTQAAAALPFRIAGRVVEAQPRTDTYDSMFERGESGCSRALPDHTWALVEPYLADLPLQSDGLKGLQTAGFC